MKLRAKIQVAVALLIYPVVVPFTSACSSVLTLWASRILAQGQLSRYMGYVPSTSIAYLFYRTQALNVDRYGRFGRSPLMGKGDFAIGKLFQISVPSLYVYAALGAALPVATGFFFVFSHLVYLRETVWFWVITLTLSAFLSPFASKMLFVSQNYQMLGWMFTPLILYSLNINQAPMAALLLVVASAFTITVPILLTPLLLVGSEQYWTFSEALPVMVLPLVIVAVKIMVSITSSESADGVSQIGRLIGVTQRHTRYARRFERSMTRIQVVWYATLLATLLLLIILFGTAAALYFVAVLMLLVNEHFVRIADTESMQMLLWLTLLFVLFVHEPNIWTFAVLAVGLYPPPGLLGVPTKTGSSWSLFPRSLRPVDLKPLLTQLSYLLGQVPSGSRIMIASRDPDGDYGRLYSGYREFIEAPIYVATQQSLYVFPDWYFIAETNFPGSPSPWCNSPSEILAKMKDFNADYAITFEYKPSDISRLSCGQLHSLGCVEFGQWVPELEVATSHDAPILVLLQAAG